MENFTKNLELDANLVYAAMKNGIDGVMNYACINNKIFINTEMAIKRCNWLKKQSENYIMQVSRRAAKLEIQNIQLLNSQY